MPTVDPRVDAYIERSADFAKPILKHIRKLVHKAAPEIKETMKWSFPHFDQKGTVCSMAAFKQHCAFGFWKQSLLESKAFTAEKTAMGSFGRLTSVKDLPDEKTMLKLIRDAVRLNEAGLKVPRNRKFEAKKELVIPNDLLEGLAHNEVAAATFENFPYSCKREYIEWITEAKTEPTRNKRLLTTLDWLAEGKRRNWKYER
jgi:uncharacterized protein YdeI (YjbR/CyaY-like superfamily)